MFLSLKEVEINRSVIGVRSILEGINRGVDFEAIYFLESKQNHRFHLLKSKAIELNIPIHPVGPEIFSPFGKNHQGLFALLRKKNPTFDSVDELLSASPQKKKKIIFNIRWHKRPPQFRSNQSIGFLFWGRWHYPA